MFKNIKALALLGLMLTTQALAAENPDELYRKGHFAEAEEAYARLDMDHPDDIRYGYNRGCAGYQNSDYEVAMAAFSSVLRRARDDEMGFKAAYNLGNTAYKQGDFESAVAYYRQSIRYNPTSEDAWHNLELALRGMEKQKKGKARGPKTQPKRDSGQSERNEDGSEAGTNEESPDQPSQEKASNREQSRAQDQGEDNHQAESGEEGESKQEQGDRPDRGQGAEQESPEDLSGELEPLRSLPEEQKVDQDLGSAGSMIDRKKAEALLDGIEEDLSRFLRFQITQRRRHGVRSGKDW